MSVIVFIVIFVLFLMFLGIPVGVSFGLAGFIGLIMVRGFEAALSILGSVPYTWTSMEALTPLPLFILMGLFAFHSGISTELFDTANKWLGRLPGGLAHATTLACTGFAACTGDSMAAAAAMGTVAYPSMEKYGYSRRLSTACIAAGGTLGILIPPSGPLIGYGFLTQTSIRDLFIAGMLPGLMLSSMFLILIFIMCKINPKLGPRGESYSWKVRLLSLRGVWGMLLLFILIIGGLYFGLFTPTEAGAIGAAGAFIIMIFKRRVTRPAMSEALLSSARISCFFLTLIIGAMIFNTFLATSGAQTMLREWILTLPVSRYVVLMGIVLLYYVCGWLMDAGAIMILTIPIVGPIMAGLGFDLVWFGIITTVLLEVDLITPPVALNLYVIQGVTKVPMGEIIRGVIPFVITMSIFLVLVIVFPQISLFLPYLNK